jgi:uncharacterized protein HemY
VIAHAMTPARIAITVTMVLVLLICIDAVIAELTSMPRPTEPYTKKTRPTG